MTEKPIIGILLGDPAGVGPEIIAKLLVNGYLRKTCRPLLIGDKRVIDRAFDVIGEGLELQVLSKAQEADWIKGVPILDLQNSDPAQIPFGVATELAGAANVDGMDVAIQLYKENVIEGFCFGPFNKAMLKTDPRMIKIDGASFESEHHYIAYKLDHWKPFGEINAVGNVLTTRTTSHIPLKRVSDSLNTKTIGRAITLMYNTLRNAGFKEPRIAVAALNPHAGENGTCGKEEIDVIRPAIEEACRKYDTDQITGPYPSDTLFVRAFKGDFDGVVTMFHDQGQIALKVVGFDAGITIAGGFEIPIVTAGHGTAYDIAGKNVVKTSAFENAVKMCVQMANARKSV